MKNKEPKQNKSEEILDNLPRRIDGDGMRWFSEEDILDALRSQEKEIREDERDNWHFIRDDDSCECDNCHRMRAYLKDPQKELNRWKQKK